MMGLAGLGGLSEAPWMGPHCQAPPSFFPLLTPRLPTFPPKEARRLPYLHKLLRGGEAAHAERHEDPAPGVAALGGVVGELLADLAVDLVPRQVGRQERKTTSEKKPPPSPTAFLCYLPKTIQEEADGAR